MYFFKKRRLRFKIPDITPTMFSLLETPEIDSLWNLCLRKKIWNNPDKLKIVDNGSMI